VRDVALVALAGAAYEAPLGSRRALVFAGGSSCHRSPCSPPATSLVLRALGLSHALLAAALAFELVCRRGAARAVVLGLCAISAVKPIYELATGAPAFVMSLGAGVVQVPIAHAAGVAIGLACGWRAGSLGVRRSATFANTCGSLPTQPRALWADPASNHCDPRAAHSDACIFGPSGEPRIGEQS